MTAGVEESEHRKFLVDLGQKVEKYAAMEPLSKVRSSFATDQKD